MIPSVWEQEGCSGKRMSASGMWAKGRGRAAPGHSSAGAIWHGKKGGRAGDVFCGHGNENIIPDGWDVMGTL